MIFVSSFEVLFAALFASFVSAIVASSRAYRHAQRRIVVPFPGLTSAFWAAFNTSIIAMLVSLLCDVYLSDANFFEAKYLLIPGMVFGSFALFGTIPAVCCYHLVRRFVDAGVGEPALVKGPQGKETKDVADRA